jgi:thiol-disulfide isomerase/thioredoxin
VFAAFSPPAPEDGAAGWAGGDLEGLVMTRRALPFTIKTRALGRVAGLALLISLAACGPSQDQNSLTRFARGELEKLVVLEDPPPQPDIMFLNEAGERLTLEQFHGKVTLVNLWATWCTPCIKEMPSLDRLEAALGSDRFEVVPLSLDRSMSDARDWYDENGIEALDLYQESSTAIAQAIGTTGIPVTVLYDPDGRELARLANGAEWDSPEARALIEAVVAQSFDETPDGA